MPTARSGLASATVNGIVYAIGGADTAARSTNPHLSTVEAYAPATNTWSTKAALPTARSGLAATAVNGIIYAIGGDNAIAASASANVFNPLTTVEAYDPIGNTWTTKAPMPTAREQFAIAAVNGVIYVFGGLVPDASFVKSTTSVEAYNIGTNSWSAKAPLTTARESLSSAAVGGIVYVMGGRADAVPSDLALVEAYDPVANAWTTKAPMTVIRGGWSVGVPGRVNLRGGLELRLHHGRGLRLDRQLMDRQASPAGGLFSAGLVLGHRRRQRHLRLGRGGFVWSPRDCRGDHP